MTVLRKAARLKESLAGPPSRRAAYYSLAQASYACLAGSFEMPMAFRLAGRIDLVAFVYAFYFTTLFGGFLLGMILMREGKASRIYRSALALWTLLPFGAAALFPLMTGIPALICYFLVRGLAEGLYWASKHRTFLWSVRDAGRDGFALKLQSIVVSLSVVLPLAGGAAITYLGPGLGLETGQGRLPSGYVSFFLVTASVMLLFLLLSPKLEIGRSPLSLRSTWGIFSFREARSWRSYAALTGFAGCLVTVSGGIQTFGVLKTEFNIGALNASVALLSGFSFFILGRRFAGRKGARLHGVLAGALADFSSRAIYAIAPTAGGLAAKSLLDALLVPLKSLLGENVQSSLIERFCATMRTSASELYLFREMLFWFVRLGACLATGLAFALVSSASALSPDLAPGLTARILLALAAPVSLAEYFFVRSFARDNAAHRG